MALNILSIGDHGSSQVFVLLLSTILFVGITSKDLSAQKVTYSTVAITGDSAPISTEGVEFRGFGPPLINDFGQTAFFANLTGTGVNSNSDGGIFSVESDVLSVTARKGDAAPGIEESVSFSTMGSPRPVQNDAGHIAFLAALSGASVTSSNDHGVFSNTTGTLRLIAREGDVAPNTGPGVEFDFLGAPTLNHVGETAFYANLSGTGVGSTNDVGIFAESNGLLELIAREGDPAPDTLVGVNYESFNTSYIRKPILNDAGQTIFVASLTGTNVSVTSDTGVFSGSKGSLELIAREGEPAPGAEAGVNFASFRSRPALNNVGQTVFVATMSGAGVTVRNNRGIFAGASGSLRLVARRGNPAPGILEDVRFDFFDLLPFPRINDAGQTAFFARLSGDGVDAMNDIGIYAEFDEGPVLVARKGSNVPGMDLDVVFSDFIDSSLEFNDTGQVAFIATLSGKEVSETNDVGIFATDPSGNLQLIAREGETFDVNSDPLIADYRTILRVSRLNPVLFSALRDFELTPKLNDASQIAFRLEFTDNTMGIFIASIAVPEPSALMLMGIGGVSLLFLCRK